MIMFFAGFVLLFVLAFSLGVIVGKGLGGSEYAERRELPAEKPSDVVTEEKVQQTPEKYTEETEQYEEQLRVTEQKEPLPRKEIKLREDRTDTETVPQTQRSAPAVEDTEDSSLTMNEELELKEKKTGSNNIQKQELAKSDTTKSPDSNISANGKSGYTRTSSVRLPMTDPGGSYTVQLGSFKNRDMAVDLEKKMSSKGYPSFVRKVVIPDQGEWYRVRIGTFNEKEKAEKYADILIKREEFLKGVYVTRND